MKNHDHFRMKNVALSKANEKKILNIKEKCHVLLDAINECQIEVDEENKFCIEEARKKLDECSMWAIRGITSPKED